MFSLQEKSAWYDDFPFDFLFNAGPLFYLFILRETQEHNFLSSHIYCSNANSYDLLIFYGPGNVLSILHILSYLILSSKYYAIHNILGGIMIILVDDRIEIQMGHADGHMMSEQKTRDLKPTL